MRVKIYQINSNRDKAHFRFSNLAETTKLMQGNGVDSSLYDEVFNAELGTGDLEEIYTKFNIERHPLHRGDSLSVSDVVVTDQGAYFCDSSGFEKIDFDESKTQKPDDLMRVLYVEPGKVPYEAEIRNTLEGMQRAVCDGLIEPIFMDDGCVLVGNEESKLRGMQGNRHLDGGGVLAGPFFICGDAGENFRSLTDDEVSRYMEKYAEPEDISDEETQADVGFTLYGF
ncbi:YodL domain-containing protein [Ruminococcus sp. JE7B6]|uniref:DUF3846 domain-containing protein n=1 Tax=Ruminococcus sp. JE7B6 TaxID=3233380 RepID=UPI00389A5CD6